MRTNAATMLLAYPNNKEDLWQQRNYLATPIPSPNPPLQKFPTPYIQ